MKAPLIGLTTYGGGPNHGYHSPLVYVQAVVRSGGVPMLVPPVGPEMAETWIERIDGLVLLGGGDIDPARYGGFGHETIYNLDPHRDDTELALAKLALERNLPTLAVCRGLQIVNTLLEGSLFPHLPDVVGETVLHRAPPREPVPHAVRIAPDSRLASLIGSCETSISSWHHQAIDRLGHGLRAVAWAEDGVIEAVEHETFDQLIAVQWHPELTAAKDARQQALFAALIRSSVTRLAPQF